MKNDKDTKKQQDGGLDNILTDFMKLNMAGGKNSKSKSKSKMNSLVKYIKKQNKKNKHTGGGKIDPLVDYIRKQI